MHKFFSVRVVALVLGAYAHRGVPVRGEAEPCGTGVVEWVEPEVSARKEYGLGHLPLRRRRCGACRRLFGLVLRASDQTAGLWCSIPSQNGASAWSGLLAAQADRWFSVTRPWAVVGARTLARSVFSLRAKRGGPSAHRRCGNKAHRRVVRLAALGSGRLPEAQGVCFNYFHFF